MRHRASTRAGASPSATAYVSPDSPVPYAAAAAGVPGLRGGGRRACRRAAYASSACRTWSYRSNSVCPVLSCTQRPTAFFAAPNSAPAEDSVEAVEPAAVALSVLPMSSAVVCATMPSKRARSCAT